MMSEATRNRKRAEVAERVARAQQQQQQQALLAAAALASLTLVRHDDGKSEWAFAEREPRTLYTRARRIRIRMHTRRTTHLRRATN